MKRKRLLAIVVLLTVVNLGYIIHHPFWRSGYAFEAAQGAIQWARENGLQSLVAQMATDDRIYCMMEGRITLNGTPESLSREAIHEAYFGAAA